jgi:lipoprotein-releasing system permease protein
MFVIAMVTAAMIIVLSAFNGLEKLVSELFGTLDAELALIPKFGEVIPDSTALIIENHPGIAHYSAILESEAIISANGISEICTVLGVDDKYPAVSSFEGSVFSGGWGRESDVGECLCLGYGVKSKLRLPSDTLMEGTVILGAPIRGKQLRRHKENTFRKIPALACGTFSINADIDTRYVIAPLDYAKRLFDRPNEVSRFEIATSEGYTVEDLINDTVLIKALGEDLRFRTRSEKHKFITSTNRAEKWATFVILSFILIVAAFNILASLTMMLIDKKDDLTIFKAMGLKNTDLEMIFSLQGLAINIIGGIAGGIIGIGLVWAQSTYGLITLEGSVVPAYPVKLALFDIVGILAVVIGMGGLGSAAMVRYLIRKIVV